MIFGVLGSGALRAEAWLAEVGAKWTEHEDGTEVLLGHTGGAGESHFARGQLLVVATSNRLRGDSVNQADAIAREYLADGLGCVRRLTGASAFILYDARARLVACTSSLTSRRPLAYAAHGSSLVVGSRVLELLRHPSAPPAVLDELYLANAMLGYCAAPPGTTPIRGIRRLPAGMGLLWRAGSAREARLDAITPLERPPRGRELEAFWASLEAAVAPSIRSNAACVSLSGGLDSAAVATTALRLSPTVKAFSIVAPQLAAEESAAIDELARTWPGLRLHRVECSEANGYPDLSRARLRDDPPLVPLSLLPARLRLWSAVRDGGFGTVLDGEGGDELFGLYVTPHDALRRGHWVALWRHLRASRGRRSIILRSLILPWAPLAVRRRSVRRWAGLQAHLPPYLEPAATERPGFKEATVEFHRRWISRPAVELVEEWLSWPTGVGSVSAHDQVAADFGLTLASPILDRGVIERVLGLSPASMLSLGADKRLLREALAGRIPESIRMRAKDYGLAQAFEARVVTSPNARQALRHASVRDRFAEWIRFEKLEALLDAIERGYRPTEWLLWQLECAVTFAEWYARASREYGVQ